MAIALLVPVTFFMAPVPALADDRDDSAMAIFAGDIPGALLRIPGTPASAAYADEAYAMTKNGQGEVALGAGVVSRRSAGFSAPSCSSPLRRRSPRSPSGSARSSISGWLLGLTCGVFVASGSQAKAAVSLLIGLLVATIGMENPAAYPRFSFGSVDLSAEDRYDPGDDRHVRDRRNPARGQPGQPGTCLYRIRPPVRSSRANGSW